MQDFRKKRQKHSKSIRSKQRFEKIARNRQQCFGNVHVSLVTMIFYLIERQTNEGDKINQEQFEIFLEFLGDQIRCSSEVDRHANGQMVQDVLARYRKSLDDFEETVMKTEVKERVELLTNWDNAKMFHLMRFLFRVEEVTQSNLEILDAFLESVDLQLSELCQSKRVENNFNLFIEELTKLTQLKISLMRQLMLLYELLRKWQQNEKTQGKQQQMPTQSSMIISKLIEKWITGQLIFNYPFDPTISKKLITIKSLQTTKLRTLIQSFFTSYMNFIDCHNEIMTQVVMNQAVQKQPTKFVQLIFGILFMLEDSSSEKDIDLSANKKEIQEKLFVFIKLITELIKLIQKSMSNKDSRLMSLILQMVVNCFSELPKLVVDKFVNSNQLKHLNCINQIKTSSEFYVATHLCSKQPLVVTLIHLIEYMEIWVLITFPELLATLVSYSDPLIEILLNMKDFECTFNQTHNFKTILERVFIEHLRIEVSRRGIWLLSNITASEQYYREGFFMIEKFFMENTIEEDFALSCSTNEELLVKETIIKTIMNFLCNLRQYEEILELMEVKRIVKRKEPSSKKQKSYQQHMLDWILRILSSLVRNFSESSISGDKESLLQVLIYSFYNILSLEANRDKYENQPENIVFILMERLEIPKCLEAIYHKCEISYQQSKYVRMLELLLDQLEKIKQQE